MLRRILFTGIALILCIFSVLIFNCNGSIPKSDSEFIDDKAFEYIKSVYADIDFSSDFKLGNQKVYNSYKEQYFKLLDLEIPFYFEKNTYYMDEYINGEYEPKKYNYYFFDMNNDGTPELCIEDKVGIIYIMTYSPVLDKEVILWHETSSSWTELLGSKKLWFYSGTSPIKYAFYKLDNIGDTEYSIRLYIEPNKSETKYFLGLPEYPKNSDYTKIPKDIKKQAVEKNSHFYYRVTENQWDELTKEFFKSKETSKENINKVKFTYDQLFYNAE